MSYKALARQYRPKDFSEMVGQAHVLQALSNSLDNNKVHHAFLFTGTRGVGKTTVARILAKALNCEEGVSAKPCGKCRSCQEVDEGRFIDLIEIDGASKTKVEDTREILENVQYSPTRGRYKIYIIDEVHMLSKHSFNALLKTLEEPPEHVKFLLATTDPQRLPVTILSRCLQFNLKALSETMIASQIDHVLKKENIAGEKGAIDQIASAADGSMRDGLSLLDQAIAYANGDISNDSVSSMLGAVDRSYITDILTCIATNKPEDMMARVHSMSEQGVDFDRAIEETIDTLHQIAMIQVVPGAIESVTGNKKVIQELAQSIPPENLQTYYQIAITARRDLPMAKNGKTGYEMALIRMTTLSHPGDYHVISVPQSGTKAESQTTPATDQAATARSEPVNKTEEIKPKTQELKQETDHQSVTASEKTPDDKKTNVEKSSLEQNNEEHKKEVAVETKDITLTKEEIQADDTHNDEWQSIVTELKIGGLSKELAMNCAMVSQDESGIKLVLPEAYAHLASNRQQERVQSALNKHFGKEIPLGIEIGDPPKETPAARSSRKKEEKQGNAVDAAARDPKINSLVEDFGATIREESITPGMQ